MAFNFPPPGYFLDNEGRMWPMSSSSSDSSGSSSSSSESSSSSSESSSSDSSKSSSSDSSSSSSISSESSSSSSDSSSSSSESSESSKSSSSSNSSSSQSSLSSSDSSSSISSSSISSSSIDGIYHYAPEGFFMDNEGRMWAIGSSHSSISSWSSMSSSSSEQIETGDDISEEEFASFLETLGSNDTDIATTNDIETTNDVDIPPAPTPPLESSSSTVASPPPPPPSVEEPAECAPAHDCLTSNEAIRRFVLDRMIDDNVIDLELYFTDEEINHARYLAVANWNEIPPYVGAINLTTCDECLPYPTIFINGIAYYLYLSKVQKLQKEDLDYNAGGMQVDLNKRRIAHLSQNIKIFKEEFVSLASSRKTYINYQGAWGQIG